MTSTQAASLVIVPLVAWRVYARVRRNIGRQRFRPGRMTFAIVFFSSITLLLGVGAAWHPSALAALAGGVALSVPLALFGLQATKFEATPEGKFYTPHTGIGVALTVLFVGRLAYRIYDVIAHPPVPGTPPLSMYQSPLTLFIFGLIAGYYVVYYLGARARGLRLG
ncbi:MAG TPA: hypothetical protein VHD61_02600 [Lacunisphaera sp.]|nr:hypothetical protein [Lacunisphaera sp.]